MSYYQKGDKVRITTDQYEKDGFNKGDEGVYQDVKESNDLSMVYAKVIFGDRLAFIDECMIEHVDQGVEHERQIELNRIATEYAIKKGLDLSKPEEVVEVSETIAKPKRYNNGNIEVWDAIEDLGLNYMQGNVVKYTARYKDKNGAEDLFKAINYLTKMISRETGYNFYELRKLTIDELADYCSKRKK